MKTKKAKYNSVTIKLTDAPEGRIVTDVTFSPPVSMADAKGAQRWGYQILDEIARVTGDEATHEVEPA